MTQKPNYKYNEDKILNLLTAYIDKTYNEHYAAKGVQTVDVWEGLGIAKESCQSNVLKYAMRLGRKDGHNPKDMMKILHYTIMWYHYTFMADKDVVPGIVDSVDVPATILPTPDMGPLVTEVSEFLKTHHIHSSPTGVNSMALDPEVILTAIIDDFVTLPSGVTITDYTPQGSVER